MSLPDTSFVANAENRTILVLHFANPRIKNYLRIRVGIDTECGRQVTTIEEIVSEAPLHP